eukprot:5570187-Prymnesium_polylepis.1
MQSTQVAAHGSVMLTAPSTLPDMPGCISSVRQALLGAGENPDSLLDAGELRTHTETALLRLDDGPEHWGMLWAQLACPTMSTDWPIGSTAHAWGEADGTVTWLLAAGAGEGEDHVELHVPPSQRAVWRPLALVRAPVVETYLRDPGC